MTHYLWHPHIMVCSDIPTTFNPYKYNVAKVLSKYYEYGDIQLWVKSSIKRCVDGKQTPYVYKRTWYWNKYRVCGKCMPEDVKTLIEGIYN